MEQKYLFLYHVSKLNKNDHIQQEMAVIRTFRHPGRKKQNTFNRCINWNKYHLIAFRTIESVGSPNKYPECRKIAVNNKWIQQISEWMQETQNVGKFMIIEKRGTYFWQRHYSEAGTATHIAGKSIE